MQTCWAYETYTKTAFEICVSDITIILFYFLCDREGAVICSGRDASLSSRFPGALGVWLPSTFLCWVWQQPTQRCFIVTHHCFNSSICYQLIIIHFALGQKENEIRLWWRESPGEHRS